MKLKSLKLKNFLSHKDSLIDFDKVNPITMIMGTIDGDFRTSNGSGKTTILEGILYALYSKTRLTSNKNATLDDVVRWNSDGKMSVELQFEINSHLYKIARTRDKDRQKGVVTFEVFSEDKWKSLSEEKKGKTDSEIEKLIGIDYDTFCASICFQQKEVDKFVDATESERKAIIKNILHLDKYEFWSTSTKAKRQIWETNLKSTEKQLEAINVNVLDMELKQKESQELEIKLNVLAHEKSAIESQIEKLRHQQILFNDKIEKKLSISNQLRDRKETIKRLTAQIASSSLKREEYLKLYDNKKNDYKKLETRFNEIKDNFLIEKQEIQKDGKAADAKLKTSEKELETSSANYYKYKGELELLEKSINDIQVLEATRCPSCYTQISTSTKQSALDFLAAHKKLLAKQFSEFQEEFTRSRLSVEQNKNELESIKERLQDYSKWAKEKLHLQDTMKLLKESAQEAKMIIDDQKSIMQENNSIVEQYGKDVEKLEQDLIPLSIDTNQFDELNKKISEKNNKLDTSNRLITEQQIKKGRLSNEIEQIKSALDRSELLRAEREIQLKERFYFDELVKIFGKEIPTLIIENTCLELSDEANKILRSLSGDSIEFVTQRLNKDGTPKEVFEIEITRPSVPHPILIDSLSNGQKFRVVFAIRVALSRLLVRRRGMSPMEFLFYDECFGALDEKGIDDVVEVFKYLKNEFAHQLIITHGTGLRERFDNSIILVTQTNGVSKVAT
jgi:exonuclease SbcC